MKKVAIYCRLSKEDVEKDDRESFSESIENQRLILIDYALKNGWFIEDTYIDDDYSGLYNDRPEFERLIYDAKMQKFSIIIAKSQSRFTRNMEHVEKYLHTDFPLLGVRFIGVTDNVDTDNTGNKKSRQITGLTNEWYCEDLSASIRSVFNIKMKQGQFLGSFGMYGYIKDPQDRHKLIVDKKAAKVVELIFQSALEGLGCSLIAQRLTDLQIPTPSVYKRQCGLKYKNPQNLYSDKYGVWGTTTIKRILNDESYIGSLVQGRYQKVSYKSKKVIELPKDKWIVILDVHEPIIEKPVYEKVQKILKSRRKYCSTENLNGKPHIFSGKVKCHECKGTMTKTSGRFAQGYDYFICQLAKKTKNKECTRHAIKYQDLIKYIEKSIRNIINGCLDDNMSYIINNISTRQNTQIQIKELKNDIKKSELVIEENNRAISSLYLDKVKNILTENDFIVLKEGFQKENQLQEDRIKQSVNKLNKVNRQLEVSSNLENLINIYADFKELSFEMVDDFIDYIEICEKDDSGQEQEVVIHWNI